MHDAAVRCCQCTMHGRAYLINELAADAYVPEDLYPESLFVCHYLCGRRYPPRLYHCPLAAKNRIPHILQLIHRRFAC